MHNSIIVVPYAIILVDCDFWASLSRNLTLVNISAMHCACGHVTCTPATQSYVAFLIARSYGQSCMCTV